jgi:uncharacterized protein with von Willebrand factor type A (vWA) domain
MGAPVSSATDVGGDTRDVVDSLLRFVHRLRAASVPVSMVETMDAMDAVRVVDIADRAAFKAALGSTLVKRAEHAQIFDSLFDIYFAASRERGAPTARTDATGDASDAGTDWTSEHPSSTEGNVSTAMLDALLDALRSGDPDAMASVAGEAVDRFAGIRPDGQTAERYHLYRVLRQLDLWAILQRAVHEARDDSGERTALEDRLARDEQLRRIEEFRQLIAKEIRRRLAEMRGPAEAARAFTGISTIEDVDFMRASPTELRQMQEAIRPLARSLAVRMAQRRRRRSRGRLDVRRTLRRSLSSGGVPIDPVFRRPRPSRPDLYLLADISGSVAEFARFTISLLQAMRDEFSKIRLFVFVDGIDEVTAIMGEGAELAPRNLLASTDAVAADGHSDYGEVFARFWDRYGDVALDPRSTIIVTGDARNNYRESRLETLVAMQDRAKRIYWLNPEPREEWDTTDSIQSVYAACCAGVFEVRNLRQLGEFVLEIG